MSAAATSAVWKHSLATRSALIVMHALADRADEHGRVIYSTKAERSLKGLAKKARISVKSLTTILPQLADMGELEITAGGAGAGDVNDYRILLPGLETEQELANKSEVTSPLGKTANKGEVSANKGEVSSNKGEVCDRPIRNNHLPEDTTPLPPDEVGADEAESGEPSTASGEGSPQAARDGERAARVISESERRRFWHQRLILDWLEGRTPFGAVFREIGVREDRLSEDGLERLALSMPETYLRGVASLVRWAEACLAGDVAAKPPIAPVKSLMEHLSDPPKRALMARRLALLKARVEALSDQPADAPETEHCGADPPIAA